MKTLSIGAAAVLASLPGAPTSHELVQPLRPYQAKQLTIDAVVAGKSRTFLFDTGEGVTMIAPTLARELGCEPWGQITGFRMTGGRLDLPRCDHVTFTIGAQRFAAASTIVDDPAGLDKNAPPIDGVVGLDLFAGRTITIAWASRRIIVAPATARTVSSGIEVPLRISRPSEGLALDVNLGVLTSRGLAWMELDSANAGPTIFVSPAMAPLFGLKTDTREPQTVRAELAQGAVIDGKARVFPDMIMDGNIGTQLLNDWDITLDLKAGRAWLRPARKKPTRG